MDYGVGDWVVCIEDAGNPRQYQKLVSDFSAM